MALTRRTWLLIAALVIVAVAASAAYFRYRVDKAAADCPMPAPPDKPATPPPDLPGFQTGEACGPGAAAPSTGTKR